MNSMCAGFHAYRVPFVMNSRVPGSRLSGSMYAGFHVCWVPSIPGSMLTGFQLRWVPCTPGSICCQFLCVLFLCVVNSILVGFHACRVLVHRAPYMPGSCAPGSIHAGFLCT